MKKQTFIFVCTVLVLANLLIFACKKETPLPLTSPEPQEQVAIEERGLCTTLNIHDGQNLIICGIDGSGCQLCTGDYGTSTIMGNFAQYPFTESNSFYLCNPTPNPINCFISFECANTMPVPLTIPPLTFRIFHLVPGNGCCVAVPGCG